MTALHNLHILIAEDDPDDARVVKQCFIKNNHFAKIEMVTNGKELLDYLKAGQKPDIILTDINMPIVDGIEALQEIFEDDDLKRIPCFVYSTSINPVYEAKCHKLGVKGYLTKPYTLSDFDNIPVEILQTLSHAG